MLISVAGREEGKEDLVVPAEVLGDDVCAALDIVEDGTVVQHDAAWRAAGAAGVDEAGEVAPGDGGAGGAGGDVRRMDFDQPLPVVELEMQALACGERPNPVILPPGELSSHGRLTRTSPDWVGK